MKSFSLPPSFRFGTATASLQIEGGDTNNNWYRWAREGHITDGSSPVRACDHWNRVDGDIGLMTDISMNAYRMSLEWARIEPSEGTFDTEAIGRYRHELEALKAAGIMPLVTLHHFSNPLWFEDDGGWTDERAIGRFERYVARVVDALGDLAQDWITINEPNVYLIHGYLLGKWPPGKKDFGVYLKAAGIMIRAHIAAYRSIHASRAGRSLKDTRVGAAHHLRIYDPLHGTPVEKAVAFLYDRLTQNIFVEGMTSGRFLLPVGFGYPEGKGRFSDFLGINYYSRDMVEFAADPAVAFGRLSVRKDCSRNDLGWEIYPEGLSRLCRRYFGKYRLPVLITENGIADSNDALRARYIYDHLYQIRQLLDEGVNVEGYYHWTLMDNFEWLEGESARFGLYHVDYETQKRTLRRSGEFYGKIAASNGISKDLIAMYLEGENGKRAV